MKHTISVTSIQNQYNKWHMFLALSPNIFLFQIARSRKTSRLFTINVVNVVKNLLASVTLVLESHGETHWRASEYPNIHLANE